MGSLQPATHRRYVIVIFRQWTTSILWYIKVIGESRLKNLFYQSTVLHSDNGGQRFITSWIGNPLDQNTKRNNNTVSYSFTVWIPVND